MSIEMTIKRTRQKLLGLTERLSFLAPFLLRLTLGLTFIETGWGKLHSLGDVTELFASLHIPMPALNARVASATEFFGGLLLLVGLGSRLVSLPLAFTMFVAIITAKREEVTGLISLAGTVEFTYLAMFLTIAIIGPGALSLDALIGRWFSAEKTVLPRPMLRPGATSSVDG
jgi:putative oxidoreductase